MELRSLRNKCFGRKIYCYLIILLEPKKKKKKKKKKIELNLAQKKEKK